MQTLTRFLNLSLIGIALTGCAAHQHRLDTSADPDHLVSGHMEHRGLNSPDRLVVEMVGKRYEGELTVKQHVEWSKVRKAYGNDSKHWQRITSGQDKDHHTSVGTAEIKAADGDAMQCRLVWSRSDRPEGECVDQTGDVHPIDFHRGGN